MQMDVEEALDCLIEKQWTSPHEVVGEMSPEDLLFALSLRIKRSRAKPRLLLRLFLIEGKRRQCLK